MLFALGAAAALTVKTKVAPVAPQPAAHSISIQTLRTALPSDLSIGTEDIIGGRMEPISLVFVGLEEDLVRAFTRAGWLRADLPSPLRVVQEGLAALQNMDLTRFHGQFLAS